VDEKQGWFDRVVAKVDDYTVTWTYASANTTLMMELATRMVATKITPFSCQLITEAIPC